jgi:hypothetical protein
VPISPQRVDAEEHICGSRLLALQTRGIVDLCALKELHDAKRVAAFDTFAACGAVIGAVSVSLGKAWRRQDQDLDSNRPFRIKPYKARDHGLS